jgi:hypothetical protein
MYQRANFRGHVGSPNDILYFTLNALLLALNALFVTFELRHLPQFTSVYLPYNLPLL